MVGRSLQGLLIAGAWLAWPGWWQDNVEVVAKHNNDVQ